MPPRRKKKTVHLETLKSGDWFKIPGFRYDYKAQVKYIGMGSARITKLGETHSLDIALGTEVIKIEKPVIHKKEVTNGRRKKKRDRKRNDKKHKSCNKAKRKTDTSSKTTSVSRGSNGGKRRPKRRETQSALTKKKSKNRRKSSAKQLRGKKTVSKRKN